MNRLRRSFSPHGGSCSPSRSSPRSPSSASTASSPAALMAESSIPSLSKIIPGYGTPSTASFSGARSGSPPSPPRCVCVIAFPLALFIARSGAKKNLYLSLVILPFWTSFLIRTYAWMFLLRDTGLINTVLQARPDSRSAPDALQQRSGHSRPGLWIPPLHGSAALRHPRAHGPRLAEASADLGARPLETLWRVTLPLCAPGIRAGAILVFVPCLGTYITSDLLGGSKTILIGNLVQNQFTNARDWPFGAALSLALMAVAMALLLAARRQGEEML